MKFPKRFGRKAWVVTMSILLIGTVNIPAESGPFENFFRRLKHSFSSEPPHKPTHRNTNHKQASASPSPGNAEPSPSATSGGSNTRSGNSADVGAPPSGRNTRTTSRASAKKGEDLPYGTPVPGKQGFVTSPFSPNSGYIDVRGFAPGTPVKDPYTGKVFLTP